LGDIGFETRGSQVRFMDCRPDATNFGVASMAFFDTKGTKVTKGAKKSFE
jgi:hypothetical protein